MNESVKREDNLKIYVAAHKLAEIPNIDTYVPIEVGAYFHDTEIYAVRDNSGKNISCKNKNFCELTACYWIWKNVKCDYVGLVHYRRYLSKKRINKNEKFYLTKSQALKILEEYDVILPETLKWKHFTVATGYDHGAGFLKDLEILRHTIKDISPEYLEDWDYIANGHEASYCNVCVMSKTHFDEYCNWLFTILFEVEKRVDITDYSESEKRIFGFMSEILLNVWVRKNKLRVYHMPMIKRDEPMRKTLKILKVLEMIPGTDMLVRNGLVYDFNRRQ